jgi:hypothetical protein
VTGDPDERAWPRCCSCGDALTWSVRETWRGRRWLALCQSPACGAYDAGPGASGLPEFLLGDQPPLPYVQPWVRFFLRSVRQGYVWQPSAGGCVCPTPLAFHLALPVLPDREADPTDVAVCLACGQTSIRLRAQGETLELHHPASAWDDPAIAIRLMKRAMRERAESCHAGGLEDPWSF